jgi:hypothetical protein
MASVTPEADSTKSEQARIVPLHPHLVEQGLLKVAEQAGDGPIFYDPARGRGGSAGNAHYRKVGERLQTALVILEYPAKSSMSLLSPKNGCPNIVGCFSRSELCPGGFAFIFDKDTMNSTRSLIV